MIELPSMQPGEKAGQATLEFVEDDLKLALAFVEISSAAYSTGRLQHAGDARSKAKAAQERALACLIESSTADQQDASVQSMLKQVQSALSSLPSSASPSLWMRRAAS